MLSRDQERFLPITLELADQRQVTLRFLGVDDAAALGDFYLSLPRATYRFYCPHPLTRQNAAALAARALSATLVALVAVDEERQIVGYASCRWADEGSTSSTLGICLRSTYRGIGLGRALMAHLLHIAPEVGPPLITLTVQKANPRAIALYREMGFQVVRHQARGQVEEFPPEPEYHMERQTSQGRSNA